VDAVDYPAGRPCAHVVMGEAHRREPRSQGIGDEPLIVEAHDRQVVGDA
jgi:hypothetical protein